MFFIAIAGHSMPSVWAYFTMEKFNWDTAFIGYSLAFLGFLSIIVQSWLVGVLAKQLGDKSMTLLGLVLSITGLIFIAFTPWQWLLVPALILYVTGSVQRTGFQSMAAALVPKNEQGELQGSLSSLMGLATIIAPPLMTMSFSYFTSDNTSGFYFPGIPYIIAAFLTFTSLLLLVKKLNIKRKKQATAKV